MGAERFELTNRDSIALVSQQAVGRMCIVEHGYPLAIPVSYALVADDSRVVVRTDRDTMLGRYEGPGSLEVDCIDLEHGAAWSVILRGSIRRVVGHHELPDPKPLLSEGRHQWITLEISAISGRRFEVRTAADGFSVEWELTPV
ncbi:MAG: pyridoxamine 5-phosphate oxidase family protein [Ilumatobacteraceae bacterium]|nr:pyridoxamine 5-phosphate oxidase family protein [Ilumatobacteraceae bacterium]MCU1387304.1 pyridoxamine 5-phosphate oxidase family protein [Ilumatobacteraceae bacterium]